MLSNLWPLLTLINGGGYRLRQRSCLNFLARGPSLYGGISRMKTVLALKKNKKNYND